MALNPAAQDQSVFSGMRLGFQVERPTAALPATTAAPIFNIVGGRVALLGIIGEVTTVIQTQANATKLIANPTAGADVDLCGTLDITADAVGTLYGITGTFATAMVGAGGAAVMPALPIVLKPGTIDLSCAATNTGSVKWTVYWMPLDEGAHVTAA